MEIDIAEGMIFRGKRWDLIHTFTKDVEPGSKCIEKICASVQWFTKESKDCLSNISFERKSENGKRASFNGQSIILRLSLREA